MITLLLPTLIFLGICWKLGCALQKKIETLQDAAKAGDQEAVKRMLAEGADLNAKDARGITALGVAVGFNKIQVVDTLLEAGADVEITDPKGNTALHYAAGNSSFVYNASKLCYVCFRIPTHHASMLLMRYARLCCARFRTLSFGYSNNSHAQSHRIVASA